LLKKIFSYGFIEGIAKGLNKLTVLLLPFFLDAASYGKIGLVISLELLLPFISLLGLERAVLRFYSERSSIPNFSKTISLSITYVHGLIIALLICLYFSGIKVILGLDIFPDLILITLLVYFGGKNLITLNKFRVDENHRMYYRGRLYIQVSKLVLVLLFVFLTKSYIGYLIGSIISAITANALFRVQAIKDNYKKENFDKQVFTYLFAFSWPFIFHGIATNFLGNADKFVLEHFMSIKDVGLYTLIYLIGSSMMFAYIGTSVYIEPLIYKEKINAKREQLLNKYLIITLLFGLSAFIIISLISEYVLPHFYSESYTEAFQYIPLIALSFLMYPFYLKSNYKMIYEKRTLLIALLSITSCLFNLGLNIYLIPNYGIYAAVIATLASFILQAILFIYFVNRCLINKEFIYVVALSVILSISVFLHFKVYLVVAILAIYILILFLDMHKSTHLNEKIDCYDY